MGRHHKPIKLGTKFGRLTVKEFVDVSGSGHAEYRCSCNCGNEWVGPAASLLNGYTKSCGCLRRESTTANKTIHGLYHNPLYRIWQHMIARCQTTTDEAYDLYGGRGIKVCKRWQDVRNFVTDMEPGYKPGLTLERIRNDGSYSPNNCRWAGRREQARNRRSNVLLTCQGRTQLMAEWSEETGIPLKTLWMRIKRGWSHEKAILTPLKK